jgi:cell division protein FtsN
MAHALSVSATLDEACSMLKRRAGSRPRLAWLALANAAIVGAVVSGYFSFPKAGGLPYGLETPVEARNVASGPALDAAPAPAPVQAPTMPAQAAPDLTATASSPTSTPTAPLEAVAAKPDTPLPTTPQAIEAAVSKVPNADAVADSDAPTKPNVESPAKTPAKAPAKAAAAVPVKAPAKPSIKAAEKKPVVAPKKADIAPAQDAPYFINVGLFADDNNARNARVKLTDAGFAAFTQELKTSKGVLTRVRVGPFGTETAAESAQAKIRAMGLEALIIQP